jgi:hypothetical protein
MKHPIILWAFALLGLHSAQAQIRINELLAVNATTIHDPDFGEFSDFVELHNHSANSISLAGYTLSDNPAEPQKWALPAMTLAPGALLLLWTDDQDKRPGDTAFVAYKNAVVTVNGLHTNFRLSGDGEYIGLFDPQGKLTDEITYYTQAGDVSFGRHVAAPEQWHYFAEPTPGKPNSSYGSASMEIPGEPVFSLSEGFYANPQMLVLSTPEPGAHIRFTYDGSTPNANSPIFSDSLPLNISLTIKARLYVPGKMPGRVVSKTYFINENNQLPVLAISTNAANLYDFDFGILQKAIKDREVPATIEYFEPLSGTRAFSAGVGLRVFGTSIYNLPQRPISVRFKEKYGDEVLKYPLFKGKPISRYSAFLLRNGGNDYNTAYFRDGLGVNLVKGKMDLDFQDYQPCVVFINGEYNGIYELRERLDEQYIGRNHEVNPDNLDYLEDSLHVVSGDQYAFRELMDFVEKNDLSDSTAFARVAAEVDLNEFTNFVILRAFIGYQIADLNNRYWRNRDTDSKWRWIASDLEHAFGQLSGDPVEVNTIAKLAAYSGDLPEWSTLLFNRLLQNPAFRDEFIQRSAACLNTFFQPALTLAATDSLKTLLQFQMPRHIGRWQTPPSVQQWQANVGLIKTFLEKRPAYYRQHLKELFGKTDSVLLSMQIIGQGKVVLSGVAFSEHMQGHFFKNTQIRLQAQAAPGYRFVAWQGLGSSDPDFHMTPLGDTAFAAIFAPIENISIIPALIASDTTLAAAASPWYGFEDITILPGARLRVEAGASLLLSDGVSMEVKGGLYFEGTPEQRISVLPDPAPSARRSFYGQSGFWGSIFADTPSDSIVLRYTDLRGSSFGRNRERHFSGISTYNTKLHLAHSSIKAGKAPLIARGGSTYIGHSEFQTDISCNGFISLYDMQAPIIEHCVFPGNRAINTDAIDIKGISNGIVRHNEIYGFLGSNCDGIDLGIYSTQMLLEGNIIHDCSDKGISVGSQSKALIRRNLIYNCDLGVAVKDSLAEVRIDQNTFYGNRHAVACYEKSVLRGGGKAFVKNSIVSGSTESDVFFDSKSLIQVAYSLSDKNLLSGSGNLFEDPAFVNPSVGNFELAANSPCIDAGDPFSPEDPDGSRADMGAYYKHKNSVERSLQISEFQYHPPDNYPTGDWIELYNRSNQALALKGWRMTQGLKEFVFTENKILAPGAFLVLCQDSLLFKTQYKGVSALCGNFHFDLSNKSGKIALYDASGRLAYQIQYADTRPWPPLADGLGATVELEPLLDGNIPADWRESYVLLGTPGQANSTAPDFTGLFINEILASNTQTLPDEHGEFDDWFELYNASNDTLNIGGLYFSDKADEPTRWQLPLHFPEKTSIPPQGFLLIWADEQPEQGLLHADFKLSAGGETLLCYQRQGQGYSELERLDFGPQKADISWGRYADGGAQTIFMQPTPGGSNVASGSGTPAPALPLTVFPNPFSENLFIQTAAIAMPYRLRILNVLGQLVYEAQENTDMPAQVQVQNWPAGMYTLQIEDSEGRQYTAKALLAKK